MREARATGVELRLVDGALKLRGQAAPELRTALREAKAGVVAILSGDACRQCGVPLPSPAPLGTLLVYGDGTAECVGCADREVGRPPADSSLRHRFAGRQLQGGEDGQDDWGRR